MVGLLFIEHGTAKLFHVPAVPMFEGMDLLAGGQLLTMIGLSALFELIGGALILLGLLTRPVAFLLSGEMAVAYFTVHAAGSFFPILNEGELAVVYCFLFLYFAAAGPGAWSLDGALAGDRAGAPAQR
jgi:putative oxidoreductase